MTLVTWVTTTANVFQRQSAPARAHAIAIAVVIASCCFGSTAQAGNYSWTGSTGGGTFTWSTPSNWGQTTNYPHLLGDNANLTRALTGPATVNIDTAVSLASLVVGDIGTIDSSITVALLGGSLTFDGNGSNAILQQSSRSNGDTISADFTLASNLDLSSLTTARTFILSGAIGGTGNITVTSANVGAIRLTKANTFNGNVTLNGGSLEINDDNELGSSSTGTRTITLDGGTLTVRSAAVSLGSNRAVVVGLNGGTLSLGTKGITFLASQLTGQGALSITNGTATFSGSNTGYTGATAVTSNGVLVLNAANGIAGDITSSGSVKFGLNGGFAANKTLLLSTTSSTFDTTLKSSFTLASTQSLGGSGTWTTAASGSATLNGILRIGTTHAAATTASTLIIANSASTVTLAGETQFDLIDTLGGADQLVLTGSGALTYGGRIRISNQTGTTLAIGESWKLFDSSSQNGNLLNVFGNAGDGVYLPVLASGVWTFTNATGTLSITPEPSSLLGLATGCGLFVSRRRTRRNRRLATT
jgi:fibronectin-binding autotransporter adhesin